SRAAVGTHLVLAEGRIGDDTNHPKVARLQSLASSESKEDWIDRTEIDPTEVAQDDAQPAEHLVLRVGVPALPEMLQFVRTRPALPTGRNFSDFERRETERTLEHAHRGSHSVGRRVCQSVAFSCIRATRSSFSSSNGAASTCNPIGRPAFVKPHG